MIRFYRLSNFEIVKKCLVLRCHLAAVSRYANPAGNFGYVELQWDRKFRNEVHRVVRLAGLSIVILRRFGYFVLFSMLLISAAHAAGTADSVFINGKIVTVDAGFSIAESVAVTNGTFSYVGSNDGIDEYIGPETAIIDLNGNTVVPGFIDSHAHMDREGLKFILPSMHGVRSIDDVLAVIKEEVRKSQPGEWIVTMPIGDYPYFADGSDSLAERRYPTRRDLDQVAPDNPVYIKGIWYYWSGKSPIVSIANSSALRLAGIDKDSVPPHDRIEIVEDPETGEPNGIFKETGSIGSVEYSLMQVAPKFSDAQRQEALKDSMRRYNAAGTTSVYEGHGLSPVVIRAFRELHEKGELTVRSHLVMSPTWDASPAVSLEKALGSWAEFASGQGLGDDVLRISGIHTSVGDSIQDDVRKNASANPGWAGYSVDSILPTMRGSLYDLFLASVRSDIRINAITYNHATLDEGLTALEMINEQLPVAERRTSFQHLSFVTDENIARMKTLGVVPVVVPGTTIWKNGLGRTIDLTDSDASTYVPLQKFVDNEIPFVFATDNVPVEPLKTIWGAVTRQDMETGQVIAPDQRISRESALRAFTINGAYLTFEEERKGSIEVGKLADLAVLSADLLTVPADEIYDIQVLRTVVGGATVHEVH
jgi:predicted amidohydrolase YtcJ